MSLPEVALNKGLLLMLAGPSIFCLSSCVTEPGITQDTAQEQLGMGIVIGTLGYQEIQKDLTSPGVFSLVLEGQVISIEGAAYVVKQANGEERRIPVDQNTTIDRPAHVGDWIAAYLDHRGRALQVRNIDQELLEREDPLRLE